MTPEHARELLGGLAAGILTPEERRTLFEAALHDQTLFNEVADELEFAVFLQSPETRAQLANRIPSSIDAEPERRRWWALSPRWLALSGVLAASTVVFLAVWPRPEAHIHPNATVTAPSITAAPVVNGAASARESEKKDAAPTLADKASGSKVAALAKSTSGGGGTVPAAKVEAGPANKKKQATPMEVAKDSSLELKNRRDANRPEPRDERVSDQPAPGSGGAPPGRAARSAAPQAEAAPSGVQSSLGANRMAAQGSSTAGSGRSIRSAPGAPAPPPPPRPATPAPQQAAAERRATASLNGTVHDRSGTAVAGATVDIVNTSTNTTTHTASDASGRFAAQSLPQGGPYMVIAVAPGFKKEQRSVMLDGDQPAPVDIALEVGAMAETVAVSGFAPMLPASQSGLSQYLNSTSQVAVMDFANGGEQNQSGAQVADLLSNQLLNGGQVRVIDRDKVQQAWQSQQTQNQASGNRPPNAQEAAALGRSIGADAVIVGSVNASEAASGGGVGSGNGLAKRKTASNVSVTAEVIDTKQAKPMANAAAAGVSIQGATNDLGNQLQSKLAKPVEGSVTHLAGDTVSVEFAEPSSLRIGARCDVVRGRQKIGELVITSVNGTYAVGKFFGTGKARVRDRVMLSR